jgi:hypothetical protein
MPNDLPTTSPEFSCNRIALAAKLSLICPFVVFLLALLANRLELPARLAVEVSAGLVALVGMSCGVTALAVGKRTAGSSVAFQGGLGLLIGLVFVGIVLTSHLRARHQANANGTPPDKDASPEVQRLAETLARFFARTTELEQRLAAAARPLSEPPVLGMSNVNSAAELTSRRTMVEKFLASSRDLSNHLAQSQSIIEKEMRERGASETEARTVAEAFAKDVEPRLAVARQIRELEHGYSEVMIQTLDLLAQEWGAWKVGPTGAPVFDKESAAQKHDDLKQRLAELQAQDQTLKASLSKPSPAAQ